MIFTETHHAFIIGSFYRLLLSEYGKQGQEIFILSTQRYCEQRGSRMAQRAIRDGKPLDFTTYLSYGEWDYTDEIFKSNLCKQDISIAPDYIYRVKRCPWFNQFQAMGLPEAGEVYCTHVDPAIVRGFNPHLSFQTVSTLSNGDYCQFVFKNANLSNSFYNDVSTKNKLPFTYHCAHVYKTFSQICSSILREDGSKLSLQVFAQFKFQYGTPAAKILIENTHTDFNVLPS